MARRSCALIGTGAGPKVHVRGSAAAKVSGLHDGERCVVRRFSASGHIDSRFLDQNDTHFLGSCDFVEVEYSGKNKHFSCVILIGV